PLALDDQAIVSQGSSANVIHVLDNDADIDGPTLLQITAAGPTARGATVTISPGGTAVLYTPRTPTSPGIDTLSYTVADALGATASATVTITILANTEVVEPANLASEVLEQQTSGSEPLDIAVNVTPSTYDAVIAAVNNLPAMPAGGQTVF